MSHGRKRYSEEFKRNAVAMIRDHGYRKTEAARRLGVDRSQLDRWQRQFEAEQAPGENGQTPDPRDQELRRLRDENRRLQEERTILKKAAAFFANESS